MIKKFIISTIIIFIITMAGIALVENLTESMESRNSKINTLLDKVGD